MGKHGIGVQNENWELLVEFCVFNDLENQIDHITISRKWRRSLHDVRENCSADAASDRHLDVAELKTKLKAYKDQAASTRYTAWKWNRKKKNLRLNWKTDWACFLYFQETQLKNIGTVFERLGHQPANSFGQENQEA